jgi:hypothetical protein
MPNFLNLTRYPRLPDASPPFRPSSYCRSFKEKSLEEYILGKYQQKPLPPEERKIE